jgi:hypothetical protein
MKINDLDELCGRDSTNEALAKRVSLLTEMVFDLVLEVEALRAERVALASKTGDATYAEAYMQTAATAHNSAGVVPSWVKLLIHFYGWRDDAAMDGRPLRELVLLRRLGVSEERLRAFVEQNCIGSSESHRPVLRWPS